MTTCPPKSSFTYTAVRPRLGVTVLWVAMMLGWATAALAATADTPPAGVPTPTPSLTPNPTPTCAPCTRLGYLNCWFAGVDPALPMVGDDITLTFLIFRRLPGSICGVASSCGLDVAGDLLSGDDPAQTQSSDRADLEVTFRRHVVAPGTVAGTFLLDTQTEDECYTRAQDGSCLVYFNWVPISCSVPFTFDTLTASGGTPTPTPTPTDTATATPTGSMPTASPSPTAADNSPPATASGDGCAIPAGTRSDVSFHCGMLGAVLAGISAWRRLLQWHRGVRPDVFTLGRCAGGDC